MISGLFAPSTDFTTTLLVIQVMARRGALLGVILLLFGALSVYGDNSTSDDNGCKRMQTAGGIGDKGILCVGQLTNDRLMVITKDWNVYQLPSNSFAPATNKLYLNDTKPVPIAEKWPQIASNAGFKRVQPILYDAFFYAKGDVNLFYMETKSNNMSAGHAGMTFNVDTQKAFSGLQWPGTSDVVLTSSYKVNKFYQFRKTDGGLRLQLYQSNCSADPTLPYCALKPPQGEREYYVCKKGDSEVTLEISNKSCTSVNWPVLHGFLFKDKIYLFGKDYVITVPEALHNKPDQPVEFDTVPYGSFIQCGGNPNPESDGVTHHEPLGIGWIIAIVLIVVLLILCCLLFLFREAMNRRKKKKPSSKGRHHKGISVVLKRRGSGASKKRTPSGFSTKRSSGVGGKGGSLMLRTKRSGGASRRPSGGSSKRRLSGSQRSAGFGTTKRSGKCSPSGAPVKLARGPSGFTKRSRPVSGRSIGRQSTRTSFKVSRPRSIRSSFHR